MGLRKRLDLDSLAPQRDEDRGAIASYDLGNFVRVQVLNDVVLKEPLSVPELVVNHGVCTFRFGERVVLSPNRYTLLDEFATEIDEEETKIVPDFLGGK